MEELNPFFEFIENYRGRRNRVLPYAFIFPFVILLVSLFMLYYILFNFISFVNETDIVDIFLYSTIAFVFPLLSILSIIERFRELNYVPAKDRLLNCHKKENKIIRIEQISERKKKHSRLSGFVFHFVDNTSETIYVKEADYLPLIKSAFSDLYEIQQIVSE